MIEPEMAFFDIHQNMDLIEAFLQYVIKEVLDKCQNELQLIDRNTDILKTSLKPAWYEKRRNQLQPE